MSKTLVTLGDLVLDILLPVALPALPGRHQQTTERRIEPGGAANTIITALNLGLDVVVAGSVGSDVYGEQILRPLRERGARLDGVRIMPESESTLVVTLTDRDSGEHVFLGHYGGGPEVTYPPALDAAITGAGALFMSGYTLVERRIVALALRALEQAVRVGTPIYMDVGPLLEMADEDTIRWVLEHTHTLFLTEDEAALVTGGRTGPDAYADLLALGPRCVVVKRGAQGCAVLTADWWEEVPAFPVERIVDTVGSGDAFDAAFIAGALGGLVLRACALLANATGAVSVQKAGSGTNAPTCREIMDVLEQAGVDITFSC